MIEKLLGALLENREAFAKLVSQRREAAFAYVVVPLLVIGYWLSPASSFGRQADALDGLTVIELVSSMSDEGKATSEDSKTIVIVDPTESHYAMPWTQPVRKAASSLAPEYAGLNATRLHMQDDHVLIETPFIGSRGPVAFLFDGRSTGRIATIGFDIEVEEVSIAARAKQHDSHSLLVAAIVAAFFGLGMTMTGAKSFEQ